MTRYKLTIEYDGRFFSGWQRQNDQLTVQEALEKALTAFCGETTHIQGAGRTDAGVHATGQVAHVDLQKAWDPFKIQEAMNYHLRDAKHKTQPVGIVACEEVDEDFNARFSAVKRYYTYRILHRRSPAVLDAGRVWHIPQNMNNDAMKKACEKLIGHHDYTSFRSSECQSKSAIKTLDNLLVNETGQYIDIHVSALSFLHNQVRIITGTLVDIGLEKYPPDTIKTILTAKDRSAAGPTAPPTGLYLTKVSY